MGFHQIKKSLLPAITTTLRSLQKVCNLFHVLYTPVRRGFFSLLNSKIMKNQSWGFVNQALMLDNAKFAGNKEGK